MESSAPPTLCPIPACPLPILRWCRSAAWKPLRVLRRRPCARAHPAACVGRLRWLCRLRFQLWSEAVLWLTCGLGGVVPTSACLYPVANFELHVRAVLSSTVRIVLKLLQADPTLHVLNRVVVLLHVVLDILASVPSVNTSEEFQFCTQFDLLPGFYR